MQNNILLKLTLVIAVIDLVLISYLFFGIQKLNQDLQYISLKQGGIGSSIEKLEEKRVDEISGITLDTVKWNTYTNAVLGFEVQYPKEWDIRQYQWDDKYSSQFVSFMPKTAREVFWTIQASNKDFKKDLEFEKQTTTKGRVIVLENEERVYIIKNGAIDSVGEYTFDELYKSFKFLR